MIVNLGDCSMPNDQQPPGYSGAAQGWGTPVPPTVPQLGPGASGPGPYPPRPPFGGPAHTHYYPTPPPPVAGPPGAWPPPGQPWITPTPPPPPGRKKGLIIGACTAAVLLVGAGATVAVYRTSGSGSNEADSASTTSTRAASSSSSTTSPTTSYNPAPGATLPTTAQVRAATGLSFDPQSQPNPVELLDDETDPARCDLADNPAVPSTWGSASKTSGQTYAVGTVDSYSAAAGVQLAVFGTAADAAATLAKVTSAVQGCTTFKSLSMDVTPISTSWTITDRRPGDGRVSWVVEKNASDVWHCSKAYRVQGNIVAAATVCGRDANAGPAQLVDIMIANATKS